MGISLRARAAYSVLGPLLVLAVCCTLVWVTPPAHAVALPGGKANYVVTLGSLEGASLDNWMRLGTYEFRSTGKVHARTWLWWQRAGHPVARESTDTVPDASCSTTNAGAGGPLARRCAVLTAGGFQAGPQESRTGDFSLRTETVGGVARQVVKITWNIGQVWNEEWYVDAHPDGTLVKLERRYNTLATHGYGYGSTASLTERRAMSTVQAFPGRLRQDYVNWAHRRLAQGSGPFTHSSFRTCRDTTWCLTYVQPSSAAACRRSGGCPTYGGDGQGNGDTSIQYYLTAVSSQDRRDSLWHWCTCLGREQNRLCYTGNSHVKPMLQVIDDNGRFRGWVGVEASFSVRADRSEDMLGVFRLADFR
jgi:hypothetical protein